MTLIQFYNIVILPQYAIFTGMKMHSIMQDGLLVYYTGIQVNFQTPQCVTPIFE